MNPIEFAPDRLRALPADRARPQAVRDPVPFVHKSTHQYNMRARIEYALKRMSVRTLNSLTKISEDVDQLSLPFLRCSLNPYPSSLGVHPSQVGSADTIKGSLVCFALNYSGDQGKYDQAEKQFEERDKQGGAYSYEKIDTDRDTLRIFALRHYTPFDPVVGVGERNQNDYNINHGFRLNLFPDSSPRWSFDVGVLDWFFMQPRYFQTNYGRNWPSKLSSAFKMNQIKKCFFLPITCYTSAEVQNMFRIDFKRYKAKTWNFEEFGLRCELLDWKKSIMYNPLVYATHEVDDWLKLVDCNRTSFFDQMDQYVNREHPFLMVSGMNDETFEPSEVCDAKTANEIYEQLKKTIRTSSDTSRGTTNAFTLSTDNMDFTTFEQFLKKARSTIESFDDEAVEIRDVEHGKGLFASKKIDKDAVLCFYTGTYLPCSTFNDLELADESKSHALHVAIGTELSMVIDGRMFAHFYEWEQYKQDKGRRCDWAGGCYVNSAGTSTAGTSRANAIVTTTGGHHTKVVGSTQYGYACVKVTALENIKAGEEILRNYAYEENTTNTYLSPNLLHETRERAVRATQSSRRLIPTPTHPAPKRPCTPLQKGPVQGSNPRPHGQGPCALTN